MAKVNDVKITVELDPESKELLRRIADALEAQNEVEEDLSFADEPKRRLIEPPSYPTPPIWPPFYQPYWTPTITATTGATGTVYNSVDEEEEE